MFSIMSGAVSSAGVRNQIEQQQLASYSEPCLDPDDTGAFVFDYDVFMPVKARGQVLTEGSIQPQLREAVLVYYYPVHI